MAIVCHHAVLEFCGNRFLQLVTAARRGLVLVEHDQEVVDIPSSNRPACCEVKEARFRAILKAKSRKRWRFFLFGLPLFQVGRFLPLRSGTGRTDGGNIGNRTDDGRKLKNNRPGCNQAYSIRTAPPAALSSRTAFAGIHIVALQLPAGTQQPAPTCETTVAAGYFNLMPTPPPRSRESHAARTDQIGSCIRL